MRHDHGPSLQDSFSHEIINGDTMKEMVSIIVLASEGAESYWNQIARLGCSWCDFPKSRRPVVEPM
jgi:hypothetical protein